MNDYVVYTLICPLEQMIRYIGVTNNTKRRYNEHCNVRRLKKRNNMHKRNWIAKLRKLKLQPEMKILAENLTEDEALKKEKELIALYSKGKWAKLVNQSPGGKMPPKLFGKDNPATRPEVRKKLVARWRERKSKKQYPISIKRPDIAQFNLTKSKKVKQIGLDGCLITVWPSLSEVERTLGLSKSSISRCCRERRKTVGGYKWEYYVT